MAQMLGTIKSGKATATAVCEIAFLLKKQKTVTQVEEAASDRVTVAAAGPISDSGDKPASPVLLPRQSPPSGKSRERFEEQKAVEAQITVFGGYPDQDTDIFGTAAGKEGKIENTLVPIEWFDPDAALLYPFFDFCVTRVMIWSARTPVSLSFGWEYSRLYFRLSFARTTKNAPCLWIE